MAELFELAGIGVDYHTPADTVTAINDVTMTVPETGITVFAGPSGSGKSTLLRVLGLLEPPTRGTLRFDGVDTGALPHSGRRALRRERLGLVFQTPTENLLEYLTVAENLVAAAQLARRTCRPDEILDRLGLGGTGGWRISALSGGQQQRLAFGCALARGCSVLLADEPTSQLDEASADLVLDTMRYLADEGFTVIAVSHDDRLIEIGTRVARMHDGRLDGIT
ncbi:ABC transporter ATP-binding protein [Amycolatopsis taiwanensis]|uniref:ABC transporter ATP-binding protein n=1 Tax=Amycolatopsis taiwanensis TaxID=342230 RepID=A0A9W6QYA0_9PSEU|nr:ATP-binding cassette domain-containing protein [Amycolatopsis taiwanensis]GLY65011.1 ABC transporter ATP-binding protein [Amycolatopsis taiwanensis]